MIIDVLGKPCPIPVIEAKKTLAKQGVSSVVVKVDNIVAVQNLEKMARGYGYVFSYTTISAECFEVSICKRGDSSGESSAVTSSSAVAPSSVAVPTPATAPSLAEISRDSSSQGLTVVIGRDTMGDGAQDLGKILIKGFLYSLSELSIAPECVIFFNSGAHLTSEGANTIDDLKKLEENGTDILTCGTCVNYYNLKPAVGSIVNMYEIVERLNFAGRVVSV